jgi:armadillo repeat-containing protein 8
LTSRLVQLLDCADLRLNALWAVKNLVNKTNLETRRGVMGQIGWPKMKE